MAKSFVDEAMAEILRKAGDPTGQNGGLPVLVQHLQMIHSMKSPTVPYPQSIPNPLAGVQVPANTAAPKRAPRGLTYPGAKPAKSPLYKFLK